jgi:hypothetical protein
MLKGKWFSIVHFQMCDGDHYHSDRTVLDVNELGKTLA